MHNKIAVIEISVVMHTTPLPIINLLYCMQSSGLWKIIQLLSAVSYNQSICHATPPIFVFKIDEIGFTIIKIGKQLRNRAVQWKLNG